MVGSLLLAFRLREYTLANLPALHRSDITLVSVYPREMEKVAHLYQETVSRPEVRNALQEHPCQLAYLMPGDFFLTGLILAEGPRFSEAQLKRYPSLRHEGQDRSDWLIKFFRLGYKFFRTIGSNRRVYDVERFIFVDTIGSDGERAPAARAFAAGVRRVPALVVDVDFETHELLNIYRVSGENRWGRLPMPVF